MSTLAPKLCLETFWRRGGATGDVGAPAQAARGQLLADADAGAMSPLSPNGTNSCRRLQELYGFFQTGGPLGRTNTEGQDELLAQVQPRPGAWLHSPLVHGNHL